MLTAHPPLRDLCKNFVLKKSFSITGETLVNQIGEF